MTDLGLILILTKVRMRVNNKLSIVNCVLRILLFCIGLLFVRNLYPDERLFAQLDALVEGRQESYALYEQELSNLTAELNDIDDTYQQFTLVKRLTELYSTFQYDSASFYSRLQLELAHQLSDSLYIDAQLIQVHLFSVAGLYSEAEQLLNRIQDSYNLQTDYPELYLKLLCLTNDLFLYKAEFSEHTYSRQYISTAMKAREKILQIAPIESYDYIFTKAIYEYESGNRKQAIQLLESALDKYSVGQRQYSIITGTLGYFYQSEGDMQKQSYYLTVSAISDLKANIRENNSLRVLATILYQDAQIDRAYLYFYANINDAQEYGSRLRIYQSGQIAPLIVEAWANEQRHNQRLIVLAMLLILLLLIITTIAFFYYKRLHRQLVVTNRQIAEANSIKLEYLSRFMKLSSSYVLEFEKTRRHYNRLVLDDKMKDLVREIKSSELETKNKAVFYQNFDEALFNIYPDFIMQVNSLLLPEHRISVRNDEKRLTTELRILALIRLGITDNQQIANILNSSIATVYTYRSRLRNNSLEPELFEQQVAKINNY